jgi:hypothetical protein
MGYADDAFWDQYGDYLAEARSRHWGMLHMSPLFRGASNYARAFRAIDLGCGQYASAADLLGTDLEYYWGIDQRQPGGRHVKGDGMRFIEANYRDMDFKDLALEVERFRGELVFVSLFSAEATAGEEGNRLLYEKVFREFDCLWGVTAGFYYRGKVDQEVIDETGGIQSYQTLPGLPEPSDVYHEVRLEVDAPSKMFGPDVVEVWRFLYNRNWTTPR